MKKRLAAVAAISMGLFQAISMIGALPAQAAAPSVGADNCFTNAGKTELYAYGDDSNPITWNVTWESTNDHIETSDSFANVNVGDQVEFVTGGDGVEPDTIYSVSQIGGDGQWIELAGVDFTSDGGDTMTTTSNAGGDVYLQYNADTAEIYCAVDGADWTIDAADITNIVVKAEGDTTINLEDLGTANAAAEWPSLGSFDVGTHLFDLDGSGVTSGVDDIDVAFTDDTFSVNGVEGQFTYVTSFEFDGGSGNDTLDAADTALKVTATGGAGDDVLTAGDGKDDLAGGADKDKLFGNANNDVLDCNAGGGADQCWGGEGNDNIDAGLSDVVAPGDGNDRITSAGALYYGDSSAAITVDLEDAAGKVTSSAGNDLYSGDVLSFIGSSEDDSMNGDSGCELEDDGTGCEDSFTGGGGDDTLVGYVGADELLGGGGDDSISAGGGDDYVTGNGGDDTIYGGKGADVIKGGAGDDVLYGLDGADTLKGGKGSDQAWGGQGGDICVAEVRDHCELGKL